MRRRNLRTTSWIQRDYEQSSGTYDKVRYGTYGGQYVDQKEQEFVATIIQSSTVLEIGTATGRFAVSLTKRGAEYTGVDLSQKMLRTTIDRTKHSASVVQMDGSELGFRSHFDYVLCIRTFHFMPTPVEALQEMFAALKPSGKCLVSFETDNPLRRLLLFCRIGASEQNYYKISDVEEMFWNVGFKIARTGSVMRIPVTLYRRCPARLLPALKRLERLWPWPMHQYVLGAKLPTIATKLS